MFENKELDVEEGFSFWFCLPKRPPWLPKRLSEAGFFSYFFTIGIVYAGLVYATVSFFTLSIVWTFPNNPLLEGVLGKPVFLV